MHEQESDKGPIERFYGGTNTSAERIERVRQILGEGTVIAAKFSLITGDPTAFYEVVGAFHSVDTETD